MYNLNVPGIFSSVVSIRVVSTVYVLSTLPFEDRWLTYYLTSSELTVTRNNLFRDKRITVNIC